MLDLTSAASFSIGPTTVILLFLSQKTGLIPDLTGNSFKLVFTANTDGPMREVSSSQEQVYGGSQFGMMTTPVNAVLTISGVSVAIPGTWHGFAGNLQTYDGLFGNGS
jgi:hypothetical protein